MILKKSKAFKKCLKKYKHQTSVLDELEAVTELLLNNQPIPAKYCDHPLSWEYKGLRELHLKPDDLLLYVRLEKERIVLMAIGSHSDFF